MFSLFISILQMFDQLGPIEVCVSYDRTLTIIQEVSRNSEDMIVNALKVGFHLRFIGDNTNFGAKVRDGRKGHHSHMEHYFGNIAMIHMLKFPAVPTDKPQIQPALLQQILLQTRMIFQLWLKIIPTCLWRLQQVYFILQIPRQKFTRMADWWVYGENLRQDSCNITASPQKRVALYWCGGHYVILCYSTAESLSKSKDLRNTKNTDWWWFVD